LADFAAPLLADPAGGICSSPSHIRFEKDKVFDARRPQHPMSFKELVRRAYQERINLGERGFYATPGIDFNRETGKGTPFFYFSNGVAAAEVELDRFTGELKVIRADVLMDGGRSINPGIDRGQVSGGFLQGVGWVTTEELKYAGRGDLLSHSPATYKIPNMGDLPEIFNIAFLDNANPVNVRASKALGEPPLPLAISVWTAVKQALSFAAGGAEAKLSIPATGEAILLALERPHSRVTAEEAMLT
jgi:xanthine dehydrogenase large subunit